jgi:hypothetical protein
MMKAAVREQARYPLAFYQRNHALAARLWNKKSRLDGVPLAAATAAALLEVVAERGQSEDGNMEGMTTERG